ncbi:MAG: hypothetical protein JNM93_00995 [Bacteriovoracaceae bacterium]|nr:hypothetical protein [Bacteriovoracaceae bacterium]
MKMLLTLLLTLTMTAQALAAPENCNKHFLGKESLLKGWRDTWIMFEGPGGPIPTGRYENYFFKSLIVAKDLTLDLFNFFNFLPKLPLKLRVAIRGPLYLIYRQLWHQPDRILSMRQISVLSKYNAIAHYQATKKFLLENPKKAKTRIWAMHFMEAGKYLTLSALSITIYELLQNEAESKEEFLQSEASALKRNQVQLLENTTPFPHIALRINNTVYSYGVTHMTATPVQYYMNTQMFTNEYGRKEKEEKLNSAERSSNELAKTVAPLLDKYLDESYIVTTIQLTNEEYVRLQTYYESNVGKRYKNYTMVNDCGSMIGRAFNSQTDFYIPQIVDASPGQFSMYLAMSKNFGDERVISSKIVMGENTKAPNTHMVQNLIMTGMESNLFMRMFVFNQGWRVTMDLFETPETIQFHEEATKSVLDEISQTGIEFVKKSMEYKVLEEELVVYFKLTLAERKELAPEYRETINYIFDEFDSRADMKTENTDHKSLLRKKALKDFLKTERVLWLGLVEKGTH